MSVTVSFRSLEDGVCLFVRLSLLASCLWTQKYSAVCSYRMFRNLVLLASPSDCTQAVTFLELCSRNKKFESPPDRLLSWLRFFMDFSVSQGMWLNSIFKIEHESFFTFFSWFSVSPSIWLDSIFKIVPWTLSYIFFSNFLFTNYPVHSWHTQTATT